MNITIHHRRGNVTVPLLTLSLPTAVFLCMLILSCCVWLVGALLSFGALVAPLLLTLGWNSVQLFIGLFLIYRLVVWIARIGRSWFSSHQQLSSTLIALRAVFAWSLRKLVRLLIRLLLQ